MKKETSGPVTTEYHGTQAPVTATPTPTPQFSRISPDPNYAAASAAQNTAESSALKTPNLADIRASELAAKRGTIATINQKYEQGVKQFSDTENAAKDKRSAGLRAMSASLGLGGSPTSFSQQNTNANQSQKKIQENNDYQRVLADEKINSIYDTVDQNAKELYADAKAENKEARDAVLKRVKDSSTAQLKALGATLGKEHSFDDQMAQDPELFKQLSEHSGLSEYEMREIFDASVPEEFRAKTKEVITIGQNGNAYIKRVTFDPVKGVMRDAGSYDTGVSYAEYNPEGVIKGSDGQLLIPDPENPGMYKRINPMSEKEMLEIQKLQQEVNGTDAADTEVVEVNGRKILINSQTGEEISEIGSTGAVGSLSPEQEAKKQEVLTLINDLLGVDASGNAIPGGVVGKGSAVGASFAKLLPYGKELGLQGNRAAYEAKLDTLKSNLTLDNLKLLKGAMSDKDLAFLQSVGSSLDPNMSEDAFDKELERLKAKVSGAGAAVEDDEQKTIEDLIRENPNITDEEIEQQLNQKKKSPVSLNRPQRNKNPGNVKAGGIGDKFAIQVNGKPKTDEQGHLVFASADDGLKALRADISAKISGQSQAAQRKLGKQAETIAELNAVYAEDPNWKNNVAGFLGVKPSAKLADLPKEKLITAIMKAEGFTA